MIMGTHLQRFVILPSQAAICLGSVVYALSPRLVVGALLVSETVVRVWSCGSISCCQWPWHQTFNVPIKDMSHRPAAVQTRGTTGRFESQSTTIDDFYPLFSTLRPSVSSSLSSPPTTRFLDIQRLSLLRLFHTSNISIADQKRCPARYCHLRRRDLRQVCCTTNRQIAAAWFD